VRFQKPAGKIAYAHAQVTTGSDDSALVALGVQSDTPCVPYFTLRGLRETSFAGFGEDEIISKNKETINNPAMTAPISMTDPISPAIC
jgi:hypothetical protein